MAQSTLPQQALTSFSHFFWAAFLLLLLSSASCSRRTYQLAGEPSTTTESGGEFTQDMTEVIGDGAQWDDRPSEPRERLVDGFRDGMLEGVVPEGSPESSSDTLPERTPPPTCPAASAAALSLSSDKNTTVLLKHEPDSALANQLIYLDAPSNWNLRARSTLAEQDGAFGFLIVRQELPASALLKVFTDKGWCRSLTLPANKPTATTTPAPETPTGTCSVGAEWSAFFQFRSDPNQDCLVASDRPQYGGALSFTSTKKGGAPGLSVVIKCRQVGAFSLLVGCSKSEAILWDVTVGP